MGRSVSTPRNAATTAYAAWWNSYEDEESDHLITPTPEEWNDYVAGVQEKLLDQFPSFVPLDQIQGEFRAVAGNDWVTVVVSDYMDMAAISLVPVPQVRLQDEIARDDYIRLIIPEFHDTVGTHVKLGTLSNGESVYSAKDGGELVLDYSQRI